MKKKNTTGVLALLLGIFGVHRFYLEQRKLGLLYLGSFFMGMANAIVLDSDIAPLFFIVPAIVSFIDAILFFVMPKVAFDKKYNSNLAWEGQQSQAKYFAPLEEMPTMKEQNSRYKRMGIESYRGYDYEGAIKHFQKALDFSYQDPAIHFNLACCYSILGQADTAFFHLEKAVSFGFDNFQKIHNHKALAFLRIQQEFEAFVNNQYQVIETKADESESEHKEDLLSTPPVMDKEKDILEKIESLGELRDKGFLTEEEFSAQKRRLLDD